MTVTQDYKSLTLTQAEWLAVASALEDRQEKLSGLIEYCAKDGRQEAVVLKALLAGVQQAYAKVRA